MRKGFRRQVKEPAETREGAFFAIFISLRPPRFPRSDDHRFAIRNIPLKIVNLTVPQGLLAMAAALALFLVPSLNAESAPGGEIRIARPTGYHLYRDITRAQSDLAHQALNHAYGTSPVKSRKAVKALLKMEEAEGHPPLGHLLSVAIDVMGYQNGDFQDEEEEAALLKSIEDATEQGSYLCSRALDSLPGHPTYLLILGGIRGFSATLKIHGNPSQAMGDGFQALKLLERSRVLDPRVKDSYMGTGIFNCTVANAPLFVRATLKIIGRSVSMKAGLAALRVSAYKGQYTSVSSQLFLIQFLSPFDGELLREKREIFRSLETAFPSNPYYTFMKVDESLCFYPDSFYTEASRGELASRIDSFDRRNFSGRRYGNLVRHQYTLPDPSPGSRYAPDTSFQFRDYEFYPGFIEALRFKRRIEDSLAPGEKPSKAAVSALKDMRAASLDKIGDSPMNPT